MSSFLGADTGNDVAAALRHGAEHIDAVELDPVILRLGKQYHPEHLTARQTLPHLSMMLVRFSRKVTEMC
jgi:spermidine synthase